MRKILATALLIVCMFSASALADATNGSKASGGGVLEQVARRALDKGWRAHCGNNTPSFEATNGYAGITTSELNALLNVIHPDKPFVSSQIEPNGDLLIQLKGWRHWEKRIPRNQPIMATLYLDDEYTALTITSKTSGSSSDDVALDFELTDFSYNMSVNKVVNVGGSATTDFKFSRDGDYVTRYSLGWEDFEALRDQPLQKKILTEAYGVTCGKGK